MNYVDRACKYLDGQVSTTSWSAAGYNAKRCTLTYRHNCKQPGQDMQWTKLLGLVLPSAEAHVVKAAVQLVLQDSRVAAYRNGVGSRQSSYVFHCDEQHS